MSKVHCLGIIVVDVLGRPIDRFPGRGELQIFDQLTLNMGGCAANTAAGLARLGISTTLFAKVGTDVFGDFAVEFARREGIDVSGLVRAADTHTSASFVMISSDGERSFFHTMGGNATLTIDDLDVDKLLATEFLLVAGTSLMERFDGAETAEVLARAKAKGVTTIMDTAYNDRITDWLGMVGPSLPHLDYFVPSELEATAISGTKDYRATARLFRDRGAGAVAIKRGMKGVYVLDADGEFEMPIYEVETVDATGAGDAWVAGFIAGLVKGWSHAESARFGNAVSAHVVQAVGTTAGYADFETVRRFQKKHGK